LASTDVRVLAITTSDGVLDATTAYHKVRALLCDLHHEGILTGLRADPAIRLKPCIPALEFEWGRPVSGPEPLPDALAVIRYVLENTSAFITFVSLGSLHTVNLCMDSCSGFNTRVSRILWCNAPAHHKGGFNYELDRHSAERVLTEKVPTLMVSGGFPFPYDTSMTELLAGIGTRYAEKIAGSLLVDSAPYAGLAYDESAALFLHFPELFLPDTAAYPAGYKLRTDGSLAGFNASLVQLLAGESSRQPQVFSVFPMDTALYSTDVRSAMATILKRFGKEEWIAGVLANEMHRHVGVYSIIGMKMGIRAKEFFGAGIDEMRVISYAGLLPPFSCLNDGLQASTGATLGHGLIRVESDTMRLPQADFVYMNQRIRLTLKPEVRSAIEAEIRELSRIYGLDNNIYWELVRKAAIRCWSNLNRHDVFTVQVVGAAP
jgi:pyrimidine-specific ribonucleoside hydrolase